MRRTLAGATLVLVAATMAACGGDKDAGDDDNVAAFCDANKESQSAEDLDTLRESFDEIDSTMLDDVDDDAKEGFELVHDLAKDADDEEDFQKQAQGVDEDDQKKVEAYGTYLEDTCPDLLGGSEDEPESGE